MLFTFISWAQMDEDILCGPTYEIMPTITGGLDSLQLRLNYPDEAKNLGIEGKVYLIVDLDSLGSIQNVVVVKGIGYGCDEEAVRLIKTATFTPGYIRKTVGVDNLGKKIVELVPYKIKITVPIKFTL